MNDEEPRARLVERLTAGGQLRIWDTVEAHITRWRGAGSPPLEEFRITVTSEQPTITWPGR
ncbi:hypothetical protein [Streptomyces prasinus]